MSMNQRVYTRPGFVQAGTNVIHEVADKEKALPHWGVGTVKAKCGILLKGKWRAMLASPQFVRGCKRCKVDLEYVYPSVAAEYDASGIPLHSDFDFS